tara:strand:+ start:4948 stop:5154 length:207 start_codon:yes stop_codon:yes gene_type:complete
MPTIKIVPFPGVPGPTGPRGLPGIQGETGLTGPLAPAVSGATGSFMSQDGKTVNVSDGIITSIDDPAI